MINKGKITTWNDDKGFGFISPNSGGSRIFVHINSFKYQDRRPEINRAVTYDLSTDKKGRICAVEVTLAAAQIIQKTNHSKGNMFLVLAGLFMCIVAICGLFNRVPFWLLAIYLSMSLITYVFYAFDKSAAKQGDWRTPESTLHLLSLFCGWPGALVAQQKLRHKTKKKSFREVFWGTVILNMCAFFLLIIPTTANVIRKFISTVG